MSRLKTVVDAFANTGAIAGAVVVAADRNSTLDLAAVGWADITLQKPMQPDTLFWIASQTKPITATALMMLVDEGKVHLDAPAEDYLPLLKDPWVIAERDGAHLLLVKAERKITVRDLLRHTSGMPFKSGMEEPTLDGMPLSKAVRSYAMTPLQSQPGTRYDYSNIGINIAGHIIEVVSGMPYETFMQQRLFDPLSMVDTTFWPTAEQTQRLAKSYRPNAARDGLEEFPISQFSYPLEDRLIRHPMLAGGLFSTASDLVKFCRMILNRGTDGSKTYLSEASIAEMTRKQTSDSIEASYGLGWEVGADRCGHGGAQSTQMQVHPGRGLITIFLVQHEGFLLDGDQARETFVTAALTGTL